METYLESIQIIELARSQEIEEIEQLLKIVLQRGASQEKLEIDAVAGQSLEKLWLRVLQSVSLIDAQDLPVDGAQASGVNRDQLVWRQQDVKLDRGSTDSRCLEMLNIRKISQRLKTFYRWERLWAWEVRNPYPYNISEIGLIRLRPNLFIRKYNF